MKTQRIQKFVAIFTAVSLAFLQAVPAGLAGSAPVKPENLINGTSVSTSEKSATDTSAKQAPVSTTVSPTTIQFEMNTGGIVAKDAPDVKSAPKPLPVPLPAIKPPVKLPAPVQAYISDLQSKIKGGVGGYDVTAARQNDGTYLVSISFISEPTCVSGRPCSAVVARPLAGALTNMSFVISDKAEMDPESVQATYQGVQGDIKVVGKLLFESLMQFQNKCFEAICSAIRVRPDPKKALTMMLQINVSSVDKGGAIHFSLDNKYYKTYRDATENVILEKELPPAVQAVVDTLQSQLKSGVGGYQVTAVLQANGTYLVSVSFVSSPTCVSGQACSAVVVRPLAGALTNMSFVVSSDGQMDTKSLQVSYNGVVAVDAQLLHDALSQLQYSQIPVIRAPVPVASSNSIPKMATPSTVVLVTLDKSNLIKVDPILFLMVQVTVNSVDSNGAIHFAKDGQYSKAFRDPDGNVVIEKRLSPADQKLVDRVNDPAFNFDFNGDGQLDTADYTLFKSFDGQLGDGVELAAFLTPEAKAKLDLDKNGVVDPKDVVQFGDLIPLVNRVNDPKFNFDFNGDGQLDAADYTLFKSFDGQPGDGVELAAFLTPEAKMKLDLNKDGVLDPNDVVAFGEMIRNQIPPVVQAYVDALQKQLGEGFIVSLNAVNGLFQVSIQDGKRYIMCVGCGPKGTLEEMSFHLSAKGVIDGQFVTVSYYDGKGNLKAVKVDGNLFFAGMKLVQPGESDTDAIMLMTKITVNGVDSDGAIHFAQNGISWKVYWDTTTTGKKVIIEREITMPDGSALSIRELNLPEMLQVVNNAGLSAADRDAAIAAINALPATAGFYRTEVVSQDGAKSVYYECSPVKRDLSVAKPQAMYVPGNAMPDPGIIEVYAANSTSPFFKSEMFFKPDGFFLSIVSIENAGTQPATAVVKTFKLDRTPYAEVYFDAQGNVTKTVYYQYDWNSLPQLEAPAEAVVFPSTMKHYDVQGNLLREFSMAADGSILSMAVYGDVPMRQIPSTVKVYQADGSLFSTLSYDAQGKLIQVTMEYPASVKAFVDALQRQLGSAFKITVELLKSIDIYPPPPPAYGITITDMKVYAKAPTAGLHQMSFSMSGGQIKGIIIDPKSVRAAYYGGQGDLVIGGNFLFQALHQSPISADDTQAIVAMGKLSVISVFVNVQPGNPPVMTFALDGKIYQTYVDQNGNPLLKGVADLGEVRDALNAALNPDPSHPVYSVVIGNDPMMGPTIEVQAFVAVPDGVLQHMRVFVAPNADGIFGVDAQYANRAQANGLLLYAALHQVPLSLSDTQAIVAMAKLAVTIVDSDNAIHFALDGKSYKIFRDSTENVKVEEVPQSILPPEILQAAQANLSEAELAQFSAAFQDAGPNSQFVKQVSLDGSNTSWTWTSADGKTTYVLALALVSIVTPDQQSLRVVNKWSFSAESVIGVDNVALQGETLAAEPRQQLLGSLNQALSNGAVITKAVSGSNVLYRWKDPQDPAWTCKIAITNGQLQYSKETPISPVGGNPVQLPPQLQAPEGAIIFPSTLKQYDDQGTLIRELVMDADGKILSMTVYGNTPVTQIPAKVEVYPQGSTQLYSVLQYNAQGQLLSVTKYQPDSAQLPPKLQAPEGAIIFPSTLKAYDANSVLLSEIVMGADGKIVSVKTYVQGRDQEIPANVKVYQADGSLFSTLSYDAQGNLIQVIKEKLPMPGGGSGNCPPGQICIIPDCSKGPC